jgi:hypothetical protein
MAIVKLSHAGFVASRRGDPCLEQRISAAYDLAATVVGLKRMKLYKSLKIVTAGAAFLALAHFAIAQTQNGTRGDSSGAQDSTPANPGVSGQGGDDDRTLEIAPQPGAMIPKPETREIPEGRTFRPDEDNASVDPNFRPKTENGTSDSGARDGDSYRPHRRPYLGLTVKYATQCYLGMEEHGLEVLNVDPNSPAAQAGLRPRTDLTAVGAAITTLSAILPGGTLLANKALAPTGAVGTGGDLIVAVDDKRVRDQGDLEAALSRLKPGDTMYLTVIRPEGNSHKTMKIAVHLGAVGEPLANAGPSGSMPPADSFTH